MVVYKIIDPYNYLLMTLDGIILKEFLNMRDLNPPLLGQAREMFKIWPS